MPTQTCTGGSRRLGSVLAVAACALGIANLQPASAQAPAFNNLTHLVVSEDGQSFRLFGRTHADGPSRPIPYLQILAAALLLPEEAGPALALGSVPGFSLDPTAASLDALNVLRRRMNSSEAVQLMGRYYSNDAAWNALLRGSLPQIWEDVREVLKRGLYQSLGRTDADQMINPVTSAGELVKLLDSLKREGKLLDEHVTELMAQGLRRFQGRSGNVFFYPEGTTENLYGAGSAMFSEPRFMGIPTDTEFARIAFEADLAIKTLASSVNLKVRLPFHQTAMEWELRNSTPQEIAARLTSIGVIQAHPGKVQLGVFDNGRVISFDSAEMVVRVRPYDTGESANAAQRGYSAFATQHYDDYARAFPALWEFRELAKVLAAARQLRSVGFNPYIPLQRSWTAPRSVKVSWLAGSLGSGGDNFYLVSQFYGGIGMQVQGAMQASPMPPQVAVRFKNAAEQLASVAASVGSGVCYDGQPGCPPPSSLGTLRINIPPPGSASVSAKTLARLRAEPEGRALLDDEARTKRTLAEATAQVQKKEQALAAANDSPRKGQAQVELSQARQAETNAKSKARFTEIKVQEAAKVIEEVELLSTTPKPKGTPAKLK